MTSSSTEAWAIESTPIEIGSEAALAGSNAESGAVDAVARQRPQADRRRVRWFISFPDLDGGLDGKLFGTVNTVDHACSVMVVTHASDERACWATHSSETMTSHVPNRANPAA
jgi:hypothetical protein